MTAGEPGSGRLGPAGGSGPEAPVDPADPVGARLPAEPGPGSPDRPGSPDPAGPASSPVPVEPPRRVRVVLAGQRRASRNPARAEIEEQTPVGEVLVAGLIRAQLALAVRLSVLVAVVFGSLPALFALAPGLARVRLLGLDLPWLLLGVLAYPAVLGAAVAYVRLAERNEQDFTEMVDRS